MSNASTFRRVIYERKDSKAVLFFGSPYGVSLNLLKPFISGLLNDGYTIVGYDFNNAVFTRGEAHHLPKLINYVIDDVSEVINTYEKLGITDFGFYGTSLGGFVLYNIIAKIPKLKWGVINAGGDAAEAVWQFRLLRKKFKKNGHTLDDLKESWKHLQNPDFNDSLAGNHYLIVGSHADRVVPFDQSEHLLEGLKQSGAHIDYIRVNGFGHYHAGVIGLLRCRKLIRLVHEGYATAN